MQTSSGKALVDKVFQEAAPFYDRMNNWMSFGLHHTWKDIFVQSLPWHAFQKKKSLSFIDMAAGTGDIAACLLKYAAFKGVAPQITLTDASAAMLQKGQQRYKNSAQEKVFNWIKSDAESTPFKDNTFDLYTVAFGLRNIQGKREALLEAHRILKPGGFFYCLEFSQIEKPVCAAFYRVYLKTWVPLLAHVLTKTPDSYRYLTDSIEGFMKAKVLEEMLFEAGFQKTGFQKLLQGVVAIHWGVKA